MNHGTPSSHGIPPFPWEVSQSGQGNEALLASEFRLERKRSAMLSELNLHIHISACGSATLYSGSIKLRLSVGVRAGAHSAPHPPDGKGERGHTTQSKCAQASPTEKSQVWAVVLARTWKAAAKTAGASGLEKRLSPALTWQCMCYGWSVHLGCKGKREKPNKLAVATCLQCQRLSNLFLLFIKCLVLKKIILKCIYQPMLSTANAKKAHEKGEQAETQQAEWGISASGWITIVCNSSV